MGNGSQDQEPLSAISAFQDTVRDHGLKMAYRGAGEAERPQCWVRSRGVAERFAGAWSLETVLPPVGERERAESKASWRPLHYTTLSLHF